MLRELGFTKISRVRDVPGQIKGRATYERENLIGVSKSDKARRRGRIADIAAVTGAGLASTLIPGLPLHAFAAGALAPKGYKGKASAESTGYSIAGSVPGAVVGAHQLRKHYGGYRAAGSAIKTDISEAFVASRKAQAGKLKTFRSAIKAGGKWRGIAGKGVALSILGGGLAAGLGYAKATRGAYKDVE